nr:T9SS type A sorting domain-containing protein [Bacteroidota bacterium]
MNVKNIFTNEKVSFQLISPLGKIVFASIINSSEPINVSQLNLPEGIYHYRIFEEQQNTILKTGNIIHKRIE